MTASIWHSAEKQEGDVTAFLVLFWNVLFPIPTTPDKRFLVTILRERRKPFLMGWGSREKIQRATTYKCREGMKIRFAVWIEFDPVCNDWDFSGYRNVLGNKVPEAKVTW